MSDKPSEKAAPKPRRTIPKVATVTVQRYGNEWTGVVAAQAQDIAAIESALGVRMPEALAALFESCNAGRPERPYYYDEKGRRREVHIGQLIPLNDLPKRSGVVDECQVLRRVHGMPEAFIPFALDNGNCDCYCVNAETKEVIYWVHDTTDDPAIIVADSLEKLLAGLTEPPY